MRLERSDGWIGSRCGSCRRTRSWVSGVAWILGVALFPVQLAYSQQAESGRFILENARIIVGDGNVIERAAIVIEGGRIVGVQPQIDDDADVMRIDLAGKTVMPALIDSHAHLGYEGYRTWGGDNYNRENLVDHLQRYAYYGFSAVFSAGSDPDVLARDVQQAQLRSEFPGARFLFAAGMAPPGQGPNDQFLGHALAVEQRTGQDILYGVGDTMQATEAVRRIAERNISVIKIWVDDRGGSQQKLAPRLYRTIAEEARARGIEVFAHQQDATDMPDLIAAGVAGFLHGRIGSELGASIARQLAAADVFVVPNLGLGELRREAIGLDPFLQSTVPDSVLSRLGVSERRLIAAERSGAAEEEARASFAHLLEAGVDILLGTDAGAVPDHFFGYTGHRELEIFVRLGMTPMQAIVAGTSRPAQRLGLNDLGLIRAGYSADMIVLEENPLDDIRNTRSIAAVYLRGVSLDRVGLAAGFIR